MRLVNTTPHEIVLFTNNGHVRLPAATAPARIVDPAIEVNQSNALPVPVRDLALGTTVHGLPAPENDVRYIVSRAIAMLCRQRTDLLVPGALRVRPPHGQIGCADLVRFHHRRERPRLDRHCPRCSR
ncbi:hypothetical protein [Nocardia sp. NPDC058705]|uniref:hypothetical protein n=1 Tax=Nocardia sp. NPDC058705 TaxID=3346609 RepID=UPI0036B0560E